jgi:hypothetical protein
VTDRLPNGKGKLQLQKQGPPSAEDGHRLLRINGRLWLSGRASPCSANAVVMRHSRNCNPFLPVQLVRNGLLHLSLKPAGLLGSDRSAK